MCCDSVIALISLTCHNRGQVYPTQLFVYILILFLIGKYVTGNASRARAELGLVLNTCLDINKDYFICRSRCADEK